MVQNKCTLMGYLGKDPELKYSNSSEPLAICRFSLATSRPKANSDNETDWHTCVAFGKNAENIRKFFKKGTKIIVGGNIKQGSYDKEGTKVWYTEIQIEEWGFVEKRESTDNPQSKNDARGNYQASQPEQTNYQKPNGDDDLPF